jgi:hypothetical protein
LIASFLPPSLACLFPSFFAGAHPFLGPRVVGKK